MAAESWAQKIQKQPAATNGTTSPLNPASKNMRTQKIQNGMVFKSRQMARVFADDDDRVNITPASTGPDDKDQRIEQLKGAMVVMDQRIKELEADSERKDLHVKELVAQADENTRRNGQLEAELQQKAEELHQLEEKVKFFEGKLAQVNVQHNELKLEDPKPEEAVAIAPPKIECPQTPASIPTPCESEGPVFVTPDTVKAAPPVPPAPVLMFPIKPQNKNGKKAEPTPTATPTATVATSKFEPRTAEGFLKDIRDDLTTAERHEIGRGPTVSIYVGPNQIRGVPKGMFMQASEKANQFFTKHPQADCVRFPEGSMALGAVKEHVDWLTQMCTCPKVFSVHIRDPVEDFECDSRNLAIMSAARTLGMSAYVRHLTKRYCDVIRQHMVPLKTIALIEKLATPKDPVFECLVNKVAHHRLNQDLEAQEEFDAFLDKHPKLAAAVEKANSHISEKRQVGKKGSNAKGVADRKQNGNHTRSNSA